VALRELLVTLESGTRPKGGVKGIESGVPSLGGEHLDANGGFRLDRVRYVPREFAASMRRGRIAVGDVLVVKDGATTGKVSLIRDSFPYKDAVVNEHVFLCRCDERADPRYVFWYLFSAEGQREILSDFRGAAQGGISQRFADLVQVPLRPIGEQREIVAEIEKQFSRLDEAAVNLQRVRANLARFAKAVLSAAVAGRLVETESAISEASGAAFESAADLLQRVLVARKQHWSGRGQYRDPTQPDTRGLGALPKGWTWASADQLSDFITKGTTPASSKLSEGTGDVQFLKVCNLTFDGSLNYTYKPAFVSHDTHQRELVRSRVRPGDILINIVGPPLGQVSAVPAELLEANINQAIARIRPVAPLSTRYIALALMATEIMAWAVRRAKTTAGQSNLTLELCRAIPIPLPPLAEQHRIVTEVDRRLSIVRDVEAEIDANLRRAQFLRKGILSRPFAARNEMEIGSSCSAPSLCATHKPAAPASETATR
jgi:type I restriction enzyme S subunit